jgi:Tfp pilus assembly protein PilF
MTVVKSKPAGYAMTWAAVLIAVAGAVSWARPCAAQTSVSANHTGARNEPGASLVAEGIAAFERNDLTAAQSFFHKALEANPKDIAAHTYLGIIADRAGKLEQAERHFAIAAQLAPSSARARNNYGAILLRLGREREAAAEFEASLRVDAKQPNALVNLAQIHFARGSPEDLRAAQELFARAYEVAPDAEIARALTVVALRRHDRAAAIANFRRYSERLAEATAATKSAAARAELGAALFEAGLLTEAETELKAAVEADPANTDALIRLARTYLARKDLPSAGRVLETSVARGFDSAPVYALLAEVYEQGGHIENAITAMRLAIQRDPQSERYRFAYGILLTNAQAPAAAVIRLEESLKLFPASARLWFALGLAHFKQNKNSEAADALTRAIKLDPGYAPAYAYLAMTRVEIGRYEEAVRLYEQALKTDEKLGVVHYLIAEALLKQSPDETASIEWRLKRTIEMDPTFTPARLALGKLYFRTGRLTEAAAELERVIAAAPEQAEAYYQLGRVYGRLKRTAEANAALARFKSLSDAQKEQAQNEQREIVRRLANVRF